MCYQTKTIRKKGLHHLRSLSRVRPFRRPGIDIPSRSIQPFRTADNLIAIQMPGSHDQFEQAKISSAKSTRCLLRDVPGSGGIGSFDRYNFKLYSVRQRLSGK